VDQTRNAAKRGAFACAIRPDQGNDLAFLNIQAHAFEGMDVSVIGVDVIDFE
jgi:hypothetical protein